MAHSEGKEDGGDVVGVEPYFHVVFSQIAGKITPTVVVEHSREGMKVEVRTILRNTSNNHVFGTVHPFKAQDGSIAGTQHSDASVVPVPS
jgi:hypothetical protein